MLLSQPCTPESPGWPLAVTQDLQAMFLGKQPDGEGQTPMFPRVGGYSSWPLGTLTHLWELL